MQTLPKPGITVIILLMKRHKDKWPMESKGFTFVSYPSKLSTIAREQKLNLMPELLNGIIVRLDLHGVDSDFFFFLSLDNGQCLKLRAQHRKMTAELGNVNLESISCSANCLCQNQSFLLA